MPIMRRKASLSQSDDSDNSDNSDSSSSDSSSSSSSSSSGYSSSSSGASDNDMSDNEQEDDANVDQMMEEEDVEQIRSDKRAEDESIRYKRFTMMQHILASPDNDIGSVVKQKAMHWIYDPQKRQIVRREIQIVPGLAHIVEEPINNMSDNPDTTVYKITVNKSTGRITIYNNGPCIPIQKHSTEHIWIPELIFGHLLTSSNYEKTKARKNKKNAGKNGKGIKLTILFSTEFTVTTYDSDKQLIYTQKWTNNMHDCHKPVIKKRTRGCSFTEVSFIPDWKRFGGKDVADQLKGVDDDHMNYWHKRAIDLAMADKKVRVYFNGEFIKTRTIKDYMLLCLRPEPPSKPRKSKKVVVQSNGQIGQSVGQQVGSIVNQSLVNPSNGPEFHSSPPPAVVTCQLNEFWQIGVASSPLLNQGASLSFVNSIYTLDGGTHLDAIKDQIVSFISAKVTKKLSGSYAKIWQEHDPETRVRRILKHLLLVVVAGVDDATFDTQTKHRLNNAKKEFMKECKLPDKFLRQIERRLRVSEKIVGATIAQHEQRLINADKRNSRLAGKGSSGNSLSRSHLNIPKLVDALLVASKNSDNSLILTEGDSANALAKAGLAALAESIRARYGRFPLKGKLMNVDEASCVDILNNVEIQHLKQILTLQTGVVYTKEMVAKLPYQHIIIMTDQDDDGSHIKALLINFLRSFKGLLENNRNFLLEFITPLVKAERKGYPQQSFFSTTEFARWQVGQEQNGTFHLWDIKYYKGLGTSTAEEGREYFANLKRHCIPFLPLTPADHIALDLAFHRSQRVNRKQWVMTSFDRELYLDHLHELQARGGVRVCDFIHNDLLAYCRASVIRAIPSVVDALKTNSTRKILFTCFKRSLKKEIKVAQLAGAVTEKAAYHHGEASMQKCIVGTAQDFPGKNNLEYLYPSGQFGTREFGGKDAASARYIFTRLTSVTRLLFRPEFDALLCYLTEDGQKVQPKHYLPILPTILINGSKGMATGCLSFIPNYHLLDLLWLYLIRLHHIAFNDVDNISASDWTTLQNDPTDIDKVLQFNESSVNLESMKQLYHSYPELLSRATHVQNLNQLKPYYRDFTGTIDLQQKGQKLQCLVRGTVEIVDDTTIRMVELPIGVWTCNMKKKLQLMIGDKILTFSEQHLDRTVNFLIRLSPSQMAQAKLDFVKYFGTAKVNLAKVEQDEEAETSRQQAQDGDQEGLQDQDQDQTDNIVEQKETSKKQRTSNSKKKADGPAKRKTKGTAEESAAQNAAYAMKKAKASAAGLSLVMHMQLNLFDVNGKLKTYSSIEQIINDHFLVCLQYYRRLKVYLCQQQKYKMIMLQQKVRYIQAVKDGRFSVVGDRNDDTLIRDLKKLGFLPLFKNQMVNESNEPTDLHDQVDVKQIDPPSTTISASGYDYLLSMQFKTLSTENRLKLSQQAKEAEEELHHLLATKPHQLWLKHIGELLVGYQLYEQDRQARLSKNSAAHNNVQQQDRQVGGEKVKTIRKRSTKAGASQPKGVATKRIKTQTKIKTKV